MSQEEKSSPLPLPKVNRNVNFKKPTMSLIHVEQLIELAKKEQMMSGEVLHKCLMDLHKLKILCGTTWKAYEDGKKDEVHRLIEIMGRVA